MLEMIPSNIPKPLA